jgi:alpha-D-ribose 1-methylphosphonate 5-triphosphate synthase subunit PhnG
VQGLDARKAERAALLDALLQTPAQVELSARVLAPLRAAEAQAQQDSARRAAATKVDFFTMVRGEG